METIETFVRERGIKGLFHFTRASNLPSILQRGLITRDILVQEGAQGVCNDQFRYDGTNAVCVSIGFPNYKMLWGLRKDNPDVEWVILGIRPNAMFGRSVFCQTNAASARVTAVPLQQRMSLNALKIMYGDFDQTQRATLNIPSDFPTNPQAEVLLLDGVPRQHIVGVLVRTNVMKETLEATYAGLAVKIATPYFRYRTDYAHWNKAVV
jgi:ssDNA thymidine ADP-ribosyltransferase, DarT